MTKTAIIIPARYGSSRLEGKPLLKVNDKPIIQWVYEKAKSVKSADVVIVAVHSDSKLYRRMPEPLASAFKRVTQCPELV